MSVNEKLSLKALPYLFLLCSFYLYHTLRGDFLYRKNSHIPKTELSESLYREKRKKGGPFFLSFLAFIEKVYHGTHETDL